MAQTAELPESRHIFTALEDPRMRGIFERKGRASDHICSIECEETSMAPQIIRRVSS
jgi:hypothetical protein